MKASTLTAAPLATEKGWLAVYAELFKARLTFLVLLTTLVGFYLGSTGAPDYLLMLHTVLGTALVAGAASAFNQLWERDLDARMRRTRDRPLPSGRLQPRTVLLVGCCCAASGLIYLAFGTNLATSAIAFASLAAYVFVYTPLKRVTWLNTAVGAVPGGLPPLIGWTAARGSPGAGGWVLFGILALWQIPHFLAIAWVYRDEYARAGFQMLPVLDVEGGRTGRQAFACTMGLLAVSVLPFALKLAGPIYLVAALILSLLFARSAMQFARRLTESRARRLFYASLLYLPLLLAAMVLDKLR
jgi:protoheme IX farnesyltransferase